MAHDLAAVKAYMRFDELDLNDEERERESALIDEIRQAAVQYLEANGVREREGDLVYDLVIKGMTLHDYDHRDDPALREDYPRGTRSRINHLKLRALGETYK